MSQTIGYFKSKEALSYQCRGSLGRVYIFKKNEPVEVRLAQDINLFRNDENLVETTSTGELINVASSEESQPLSRTSVKAAIDKEKEKTEIVKDTEPEEPEQEQKNEPEVIKQPKKGKKK